MSFYHSRVFAYGGGSGYETATERARIWAFPYTYASLPVGEELKEALDRKQGEVELRMSYSLNIGQPDGGAYNVFVE